MRALFLQEIKTFFRSPSSIFIFVIPLILLVGLGYFIPAAYIIPSSISVGIVGAVLLYFGGGLEEIKRTSFLKVMGTTKLNKVTTLVVKMSFAALISMFTVIWVLGLGYLFSAVIPFLATDFGHLDPSLEGIPGKVQWDSVQWVILFYASALSLCVTLALAFCFAAIAKSSLSFYLLTFGYIAALILFGGVIMPGFLLVGNNWFHWFYYLIPNYYSGNQLTAAFNSGLSQTVYWLLGIFQTVLDNHTFPGLTERLLDFQKWIVENPNFVTMWNDMATAVTDAGPDGVPDFSQVDGGEHREYTNLFWNSYGLIGLWGLKVYTTFSEAGGGIPGIIEVWGNFAEKTFKGMGEYKIDEIFYLFYSIPTDSIVGKLINEGAVEISKKLSTLINNYIRFNTDLDLHIKSGTYYIWPGLVGHTDGDGEVVDGVLGYSLATLTNGIIKNGTAVVNILASGTVDTIRALIGSMEYSKAFDFTNTKSIIDVFMPYVWIAFLAGISAWKFEWVN